MSEISKEESLYRLANHVASAKGGLPEEWQAWADEIEADLRELALRERSEPVAGDPLPCPFCGGTCDPAGWLSEQTSGPECDNCGATAENIEAWNRRTAPPAPVVPMQPLVIDAKGTLRFKENPIVRKLLDYSAAHGYGLNEMALEKFDAEDRMQLAQLIGYSLSGYGSLSYVSDESYARAASMAAPTKN